MSGTRHVVTFAAPRRVEVREEPLPDVGPRSVRVRTTRSGISPGTERLVYRGDAPSDVAADASIDALDGGLDFPIAYGYSAVGEVDAVGAEVDASWVGRRVFAFQPHATAFVCPVDAVVPLPDALSDDAAACLPSLETAFTLVMDARPGVGDRVVVVGQGVVGLLTTALLSAFPLDTLVTLEPSAPRRARSTRLGAAASFDPATQMDAVRDWLHIRHPGEAVEVGARSEDLPAGPADADAKGHYEGADVVVEVSGQPEALNDAVAVAGFGARIVVGSWYGAKTAPVQLGGRFHRGRMEIASSQVSTIPPSHRGRWSPARRLQAVVDRAARAAAAASDVSTASLVTHRFGLDDAPEAYELLDDPPPDLLQPVFEYA